MTRRLLALTAFAAAWVIVLWTITELLMPAEPEARREGP